MRSGSGSGSAATATGTDGGSATAAACGSGRPWLTGDAVGPEDSDDLTAIDKGAGERQEVREL